MSKKRHISAIKRTLTPPMKITTDEYHHRTSDSQHQLQYHSLQCTAICMENDSTEKNKMEEKKSAFGNLLWDGDI